MTDPILRRQFKRKFDEKEDVPVYLPALLGNGSGTVLTSTVGVYYVRINDLVTTVICTVLPPVNDLPVWVYHPAFDDYRWYVHGQRFYGSSDPDEEDYSGIIRSGGQHAETHRFFGNGASGGTDILWVDYRQIMPLRIYAVERFTIGIFPWHVLIDDVYKLIGTQNEDGSYSPETLDLENYAVPTADSWRMVKITIDNTGAVVATPGDMFLATDYDPATDIPASPANTRWVLGAIRLYYGMTEIQEGRENTDIIDLRFPMWHMHAGGTELELDLDELQDVTITDPANDELIVSSSGVWINKTLAEAGISAVGHNHTESDITDLDHNATSIDGVGVDLTGLVDGNALVYDDNEGKIVPGAGGVTTFVELTDAPVDYSDDGGKYVRVKSTEDVLDVDEDDIVDKAAAIEGVDAAGNGKYYGTDAAGDPGFYSIIHQTVFTFSGELEITNNPLRLYNELGLSQTIIKVFLSVGTAPTGSSLVVDVHKNGTTIFTNQGNRPSIPSFGETGSSTTIENAIWADGEYLTAHIDAVGSGFAGSDLVVHIVHT